MTSIELANRRLHYGLSQAKLAERLGKSANTIARWESGALKLPKWLAAWFRGEFGEVTDPHWRGLYANTYGNVCHYASGTYSSPAEAYSAIIREFGRDEHWKYDALGNTVIVIRRWE